MHAEIIAIGDEITSGQLLDTNSQWLSQRLEELGIRVLYHSTIGDELEPSIAAFRLAIDRADVVIVTGGLGPTADDLTREALAQATRRPLQQDPKAMEYIRCLFARRNRPMPPQNELQAMFPQGSRVVHNPHGTAPGIDLEIPRTGRTPCRMICLPGVPAEMVEMWGDSVATTIDQFVGGGRRVVRRRLIHCFGAGESQIESMLPDMIRRGRRPTVGITAGKATITLRIAADGDTEEECRAAMKPTIATIRECLGTLVFGEEDDDLQHVVLRLLQEQKKTLATAECGTSGLVAQWLSGVEGFADVYRGGLVLPKSNESAETMAEKCRQEFNADIGLSVGFLAAESHTDEASPQPMVALATSSGVQQKPLIPSMHPALTYIFTAKQALNHLRLSLL
jgi:nicotinamide-nucleotide amidase